MARFERSTALTTLLIIVLVHADILNENITKEVQKIAVQTNNKQTTKSTYKLTKPSKSTVKEPNDITNEYYQDSYSTSIWAEVTEPSSMEQHSTRLSDNMYQSVEQEMSTISSTVDNQTSNSTYRWTTESSTINSLPPIIPAATLGVGVVVMILNALVMVASARNSELRQNTNYNLVMGLSLSDFLMGYSSFIAGSRLLFPKFSGVLVWCIMVNLCGITSLIMSLFQIFLISLHRFLVLSENVWAQRLFDGNRKYYIYIVSWATTCTLIFSLVSPVKDQSKCFYSTVFGQNIHIVRQILCVFSSTLMMLTLIFYALTIYQVRKRYMNMSSGSDAGRMEDMKRKRIIKSMKLVSKILLALFLFTGPFNISLMFTTTPQKVAVGTFAAANFNSILNPIIYCFHITQLKMELKLMFCCNTNQ
ncbi:melanocyte-stimulating hormone receptor-like [Saccostrea echinata]|uniref:melanocyte-stimulating hormone receptor-like n=1 Tax=Saccostrea echinata TaxID=191078 RepID=UPI002A82AAFB|nr:melanocyte-stimulating hormone receptor-like [Saccostrea echinata]